MKSILIAVILMFALFGYAQIPNIATIDYPRIDPIPVGVCSVYIDTMGERLQKEATVYTIYNFDDNDTLEINGIKYVAINDTLVVFSIDTFNLGTMNGIYDTLSIDSVWVMNAISESITVGGDYIFVSPNRFDIDVTRAEYELMQRDLKEVKIWMNVIKWTAIISIILSLIFLPIVIHNNKEEAE